MFQNEVISYSASFLFTMKQLWHFIKTFYLLTYLGGHLSH